MNACTAPKPMWVAMKAQPTGKGDKYRPVALSAEYGERRWAVEDLSVQRDNLIREWRSRAPGMSSVKGVKKPKTGMIWRGTEEQAIALAKALNNAKKLGNMSVAHDPPTRENARAYAASRATRPRSRTTTANTSASFARCEPCGKMVKQPHEH